MKIGNVDVPCGCDQRKEIMFTKGNPSIGLALVVGVPIAVLAFLILSKRGK